MVSMYTMGCFTKIPMHLRAFSPSSIGPVASTMWKRNFNFWLFQKHLIILIPHCLILLPTYAVRLVQSASSFFSALPLASNIAGHSFLKTYIGMIFAPVAVSILHFTSMEGLLILPFVSSGHMVIPVKACDLSPCCMLWITVTLETRLPAELLGHMWHQWSQSRLHCQSCYQICHILQHHAASALIKWMGADLGSDGLVPGRCLMVVVYFLCNFCTCWPWLQLLLEYLHTLAKCPTLQHLWHFTCLDGDWPVLWPFPQNLHDLMNLPLLCLPSFLLLLLLFLWRLTACVDSIVTVQWHYTYVWLPYPSPSLYLPDGILFLFCLYLLASCTLFWGLCLLQQGSWCQLSWCLWLISCRLDSLCDHCICHLPQTCKGHNVAYFMVQIWRHLLRTLPN